MTETALTDIMEDVERYEAKLEKVKKDIAEKRFELADVSGHLEETSQ